MSVTLKYEEVMAAAENPVVPVEAPKTCKACGEPTEATTWCGPCYDALPGAEADGITFKVGDLTDYMKTGKTLPNRGTRFTIEKDDPVTLAMAKACAKFFNADENPSVGYLLMGKKILVETFYKAY